MAKSNNPEGVNQYTKKGGTFARLGQSLGGGLESVKMQAQGALKGAQWGAPYIPNPFKNQRLGTTALISRIKGASLGRDIGALAAKVSNKGEAAGAKIGAKIDRNIEKAGYVAQDAVKAASATAQKIKNRMWGN